MGDAYRTRMLTIAEDLRAQGVGQYTSAPPIYRLSWRLGLHTRPPLYQSFASLALGNGAWFAVVWGLAMWLLVWRGEGWPVTGTIGASTFAGLLFGLVMASYYRWKASRLKLPPLDDAAAA